MAKICIVDLFKQLNGHLKNSRSPQKPEYINLTPREYGFQQFSMDPCQFRNRSKNFQVVENSRQLFVIRRLVRTLKVVLIFIGWPVGFFCAALFVTVSPFSACLGSGCDKIAEALSRGVNWPKGLGKSIANGDEKLGL